jgi:beta-carotene hydroxylase
MAWWLASGSQWSLFMERARPISLLDLAGHSLHIALPLAVLLRAERLLVQVTAAALLFLGFFTLVHDAMHSALGLSRRTNGFLLSLAAALIGVSGHANRRHHFHHHAHPMEANDAETAFGERRLSRALWCGVVHGLSAPLESLRNPRALRRELVEWSLALALSIAAFASGSSALMVYGVVTFALRLSLPVWGGLVPHEPPAWLLSLLRLFHATHLPMFSALLDHAEHHLHPRLGTYSLTRSVRARRAKVCHAAPAWLAASARPA